MCNECENPCQPPPSPPPPSTDNNCPPPPSPPSQPPPTPSPPPPPQSTTPSVPNLPYYSPPPPASGGGGGYGYPTPPPPNPILPLKKPKFTIDEEDQSQPWLCEETDPFTLQIHNFGFPKRIRISGYARLWFDKLPLKSIDSYVELRKAFLANFFQQKKYIKDRVEIHHIKQRERETTKDFMECFKVESMHVKGALKCMRLKNNDGQESPMVIEEEKRVHLIHRMYVDGGDAQHSTSARMDFMVVRSLSSYDGIIKRPRIRKIYAVPLAAHGMLKFLLKERVVMLHSSTIVPVECRMASEPRIKPLPSEPMMEKRIKIAFHLEYPDQTVTIGGCLSEK
uniref:Reverse transcriptase domain-containing protein n=1 Tax=Tanacetum cinerariifolium TaxID=118510 RepID=A0A6L2NVX4_TANCI|nr:reverse transcriptase domain-containing protein [Tanacetum cinerariifolium]